VIAAVLLDKGAEINAKDKDGETVAVVGHADVVEVPLTEGRMFR